MFIDIKATLGEGGPLMNLAIAAFIVLAAAILGTVHSIWLFVGSFIAGALFVVVHFRLIKPWEHEPVGIAYLLVVLASLVGIMFPSLFGAVIESSALFLAGTLFYTTFKELNKKAKAG